VHEAYPRLSGLRSMPLESRLHFYGPAVSAMRRIPGGPRARRGKRGGGQVRVPLETVLNLPIDLRVDFVRLDEALSALAAMAPDKARVFELWRQPLGAGPVHEAAHVVILVRADGVAAWPAGSISAASHSAVPVAAVTHVLTTRPW
jgi:hypothetical protein